MKESIEDYRKDGVIDLDEYFSDNPSNFTYPYYIDGYDEKNFWSKVRKGGEEKFIYIKPRDSKYIDNSYNVYSELLYEELMKQVGIKTASFDLAKYEGDMATISENILDKYSYNQFIINGSELLGSRRYLNNELDYDIEDMYDTIHEYCMDEYLDEDIENKCISDIQKMCIADIFTLSTDRKVTDMDFIVGIDDNGDESIELAPLCHNTYCLGSNFSKEEVYEMLENEDMLADRANLCYFDAGVPEYKRQYDYPYWEDTLYYLIDEDEENLSFAKKCAETMDIDKAINSVEEKIENRIPEEYKEFIRTLWDNRLQNICECIGIDYFKIMDNKCYEYEMEER
jgi:hypothetical protein